MSVKKPAELDFSNKKFMVIISGQPGLGKTTLALSAPKPFLFDTDNGVARVKAEHRCPTSTVSIYEELLDDMKSEEYWSAETIVIDTGGTLVQLMKGWAKKQDSRAAKNGQAMFGVIKQEFDRLCYQIRTQDQKNLVVVFHTTEQSKGDTIQTRLSCEGSSKDIVWTPADLGGHLFVSGGKRLIGFTPTDEYFAKGCYGIGGVMEIPTLTPGMPNDFLTRLIHAAQAQLEADNQVYQSERDGYAKAMEAGKAAIDGVKDQETAKVALDTISSLEHFLTSKAELRSMFSKKLKEVGLKYSKETDAFELLQKEAKQ